MIPSRSLLGRREGEKKRRRKRETKETGSSGDHTDTTSPPEQRCAQCSHRNQIHECSCTLGITVCYTTQARPEKSGIFRHPWGAAGSWGWGGRGCSSFLLEAGSREEQLPRALFRYHRAWNACTECAQEEVWRSLVLDGFGIWRTRTN